MDQESDTPFRTALMSGAVAGLCVDMTLFPLDTIKTRLQSPKGFLAAGGYRGIYSGVASAALGSMPTAAAFFCTYELVKAAGRNNAAAAEMPLVHAMAASLGEVAACLIRVPVEVVKQRAQASRKSSKTILLRTLQSEGPRGLYRGFTTTVLREMPFSFIQFPIWENLKSMIAMHRDGKIEPWQSAVCGSASGAFAAALTNPLDVAKTRIMLAKSGTKLATGGMVTALVTIMNERGPKGLAAGIVPRVLWMSCGGFIFLGTYDTVKMQMANVSVV